MIDYTNRDKDSLLDSIDGLTSELNTAVKLMLNSTDQRLVVWATRNFPTIAKEVSDV